MLTIRGVFDGKSVKILPGEPVPAANGDVPVIITFLETTAAPVDDSPLTDETSEEIEADEARWDALLAASPEKMLALAREALEDIQAGKTTGIEIVDGELKANQ